MPIFEWDIFVTSVFLLLNIISLSKLYMLIYACKLGISEDVFSCIKSVTHLPEVLSILCNLSDSIDWQVINCNSRQSVDFFNSTLIGNKHKSGSFSHSPVKETSMPVCVDVVSSASLWGQGRLATQGRHFQFYMAARQPQPYSATCSFLP